MYNIFLYSCDNQSLLLNLRYLDEERTHLRHAVRAKPRDSDPVQGWVGAVYQPGRVIMGWADYQKGAHHGRQR